MKYHKILALENIIETQKQLQKASDECRHLFFEIKKFTAFVFTIVVNDNGVLKWHANIRLFNKKKLKFKLASMWWSEEYKAAKKVLDNELFGAGDEDTQEEFRSKYGLHLTRELTQEEQQIALYHKLEKEKEKEEISDTLQKEKVA